jgi:hypothetical protein
MVLCWHQGSAGEEVQEGTRTCSRGDALEALVRDIKICVAPLFCFALGPIYSDPSRKIIHLFSMLENRNLVKLVLKLKCPK